MIALPDVNVLVALAWPNHVHHPAAVAWFEADRDAGWATCPVTESGFLRVSSNRKAILTARPIEETAEMLRAWRNLPGHDFWADDVCLVDGDEIDIGRIVGYRQITDAHLLALAIRRSGRLVTFDRAVASLSPAADNCLVLAA